MQAEGLQLLLIGLMVLLAGHQSGLPSWLVALLQPVLQVINVHLLQGSAGICCPQSCHMFS